jgi:hypothetical protein
MQGELTAFDGAATVHAKVARAEFLPHQLGPIREAFNA